MLDNINSVHFVGIGGIGMSGLAKALLQRGVRVQGSDISPSKITNELTQMGASIYTGHNADNVNNVDLVVYSSAIQADNHEMQMAKASGIPTWHRSKMLAELTKDCTCIAVTGAHGKTTTSAMIVAVLRAAGKEPDFIIGGIENVRQTNAFCTSKPSLMVVEADESDGSFIGISPQFAVLTNVDIEHMDYYDDMEQLESLLGEFIEALPSDGCLIYNADDERLARLCAKTKPTNTLAFSLQQPAQVQAQVSQAGRPAKFRLFQQGQPLCEVNLAIGGLHNVSNAAAAAAVALKCGCQAEDIKRGLEEFAGVRRRSQLKGEGKGIKVYDDYAHHPTEIRALLETMRAETSGRLWAVFQPHRYSRFSLLYDDFLAAFGATDNVLVLPVYSANEEAMPDVSADKFSTELQARGCCRAEYKQSMEEVLQHLQQHSQAGDVVITVGAGDVFKVGEMYSHYLEAVS